MRSNRIGPIVSFCNTSPESAPIVAGELSTFRQLETNCHNGATSLNNLILTFTRGELCAYVDARIIGLADTSQDWIYRSAKTLWVNTRGELSQDTLKRLREATLRQYSSVWSHSKTLSFAKAFLRYLTKIRLDTRYGAYELFLEMPKLIKARMAVTSRIITHTDIENVLTYIKRTEREGRINSDRALEFTAFILFSAYTGQRSVATVAKLTVKQFRDAIKHKVLHVKASQDKIRFEHYVPLHPEVIDAIIPLLNGKAGNETLFRYNSIGAWVKRAKIPLTRIHNPFVLGDLRKFAEQYGDVIGWEQSNRAYIMTHGVSGVVWKHYRNPLPENIYTKYMESWKSVHLDATGPNP